MQRSHLHGRWQPARAADSGQQAVRWCVQKRIVVTGMGVVSSVGHDLDTFFGNLCAGKSGVSTIESFDCDGWATRIAGEVKDFDAGDLVSRKMARRLDRSILFSLAAGKRALLDAGLPLQIKCAPVLNASPAPPPLSQLHHTLRPDRPPPECVCRRGCGAASVA